MPGGGRRRGWRVWEPRTVAIRKATAGDVEGVRALVERAYARYVPRIGLRPGPMDADHRALVEAGLVFVVGDPEIVGVIVLRRADDHLLVENVAVDPSRQGQGLGRELLRFAEEEARRLGFSEMRLYTHELMSENIELYGRQGWEEYERRAENGFSRVFFRKRLPAA
jgi:GNAT superfamily N-acetyltransferase